MYRQSRWETKREEGRVGGGGVEVSKGIRGIYRKGGGGGRKGANKVWGERERERERERKGIFEISERGGGGASLFRYIV